MKCFLKDPVGGIKCNRELWHWGLDKTVTCVGRVRYYKPPRWENASWNPTLPDLSQDWLQGRLRHYKKSLGYQIKQGMFYPHSEAVMRRAYEWLAGVVVRAPRLPRLRSVQAEERAKQVVASTVSVARMVTLDSWPAALTNQAGK